MGDERDETLSGYDSLIRTFELEPPDGFASMDDFNAELNVWLDRVHPATREYLNQSLRGGTQTADHAVRQGSRAGGENPGAHRRGDGALYRRNAVKTTNIPSCRGGGRAFDYSGSWSSRLRDCGFHVNHVHPMGWISSCYYVAVPKAVEDASARQGWIKFGEPGLDVPLKDAHPPRHPAAARPAGAVSVLHVARHHPVPRRAAADDDSV